jgi:hypothetical protein
VLVENFVTLIRFVRWDGSQVVNPRPIAKPKRWQQAFKKDSTTSIRRLEIDFQTYYIFIPIDNFVGLM